MALYFDVTLDCMLDCVFCSRKPVNDTRLKSFEEFRKFLEAHGDAEIVYLTGGEPLLNPEIVKMIKLAKDLGKTVNIQTNGVLLEKMAEALKRAGLDGVYISIHSMDPDLEFRISGEKLVDVLERKLRGIERAHEAGLSVSPVTVINRMNYRHFPEMVGKILARFPWIEHWVINFVDPTGKALMNRDVVPKYSEVELYLTRALTELSRRGVSFRVERVPLCYMAEFAEYSTEARRIYSGKKLYSRIKGEEDTFYTPDYWKREYVRGEACRSCFWNKVCPGVNVRYAQIYGTSELYPIFAPLEPLLHRLGED